MYTTVAVEWNMYEQCGRHICSGAYTNNMKCTYTRAPGHIVDSSKCIGGIYIDIIALHLS